MSQDIGRFVSVCVLVYNHAHLIESTLDSVLDQTISDYEVLISDDCSTDQSWQVLQSYARRDPRVRVVRTPRNLGMAGNANFAVALTDRPFIALLHHDDLYRRDLLEKWAQNLLSHPENAFVFNPYRSHKSNVLLDERLPHPVIDGPWLLENYLLPRWGSAIWGTAMIRRTAWERVGGIRERFGLLADVDLWMRLARSSKIGYVPEPLISIRHQRKEDYPEDYQNGKWSWRRQRILYEIHAVNRLEYWDFSKPRVRMKWLVFRWRLSFQTLKWITYGLVRGRKDVICGIGESKTRYDFGFLDWVRSVIVRLYRSD